MGLEWRGKTITHDKLRMTGRAGSGGSQIADLRAAPSSRGAGSHGTGFVPWAFCARESTNPRHRNDAVATNSLSCGSGEFSSPRLRPKWRDKPAATENAGGRSPPLREAADRKGGGPRYHLLITQSQIVQSFNCFKDPSPAVLPPAPSHHKEAVASRK